MADSKITALTAISTVDPTADPLVIVDVSDTSMAASGTTKKSTINQLLGSGGTATLASATITGDLTVDTSTLKVAASNNRVGVNTATPESDLDVRGLIAVRGTPTFPTTGVGPELFWSPGNSNSNLYSYNRGTSGWAELVIGSSNLLFQINGVNSARLDSVNDFNLFSGNLKVSSGKGIDFSATTSGSGTMTSELLNDYEEGTWTATLKGSVSDPTTPVTATGRYTKIGRAVTVAVNFSGVNTTGASGDVSVIGLPFANGLVAYIGSAAIGASLAYSGTLTSVVDASGTTVFLVSQISSSYAALATHVAGANKNLTISITYTV